MELGAETEDEVVCTKAAFADDRLLRSARLNGDAANAEAALRDILRGALVEAKEEGRRDPAAQRGISVGGWGLGWGEQVLDPSRRAVSGHGATAPFVNSDSWPEDTISGALGKFTAQSISAETTDRPSLARTR